MNASQVANERLNVNGTVKPKEKRRRKWLIPLLLLGSAALVAAIVIPIVLTKCKPDNSHPVDADKNIDGSNWSGVEKGSLEYTFNEQTLEVTYKGYSNDFIAKNLIIPDVVYDKDHVKYKVAHINIMAFAFANISGDLTISNNLIDIDDGAFQGCKQLNGKLTLGSGINHIGNHAFWETNFTAISIDPENSTYVLASSASVGQASIVIPKSVSNPDNDFDYTNTKAMPGLAIGSLTIKPGTTTIGEDAFSDCSGLTNSLSIPASVEEISSGAFRWTNFTSIQIANGNSNYAFASTSSVGTAKIVIDMKNRNDDNDFHYDTDNAIPGLAIDHLTIPGTVTKICDRAFEYCSGLTGSLTIPAGVTEIGRSAFAYCYNFTGRLEIPGSLKTIGLRAFFGDKFNSVQFISEKLWYQLATNVGSNASVIIPNDDDHADHKFHFSEAEGICDKAIGCLAFGSMTIDNNYDSVGDGAFLGCSGLTGNLIIPDNYRTLEGNAFKDCDGLTELTIRNNVNDVQNQVFTNCINIKNLNCYAPASAFNGEMIFSGLGSNVFSTKTIHVPKTSSITLDDFIAKGLPKGWTLVKDL